MKMLLILNATYFEQNSKSLEFISEILVIYAVYFESRYYVHFALSTFFLLHCYGTSMKMVL